MSGHDSDSDAPEELTQEQAKLKDATLRKVQRENKSSVYLEYRSESQRLDQCSRLYDSSVSSEGFEYDASRIVQELGGINTAMDRQKAVLQELMIVAKDMLRNAEIPVWSFMMLQQTVVRFEKYLTECRQWVEELEQLLALDSDKYSRHASLLESLPKVMSNEHDFFVHVAAKVESIHQYIETMRTSYLADQRRRGECYDPFLEADRRETAKQEAAAKIIIVLIMDSRRFTVVHFSYGGHYSKDGFETLWIPSEDKVYALVIKKSFEEVTYFDLLSSIYQKLRIDEAASRLVLSYIALHLEPPMTSYISNDEEILAYFMTQSYEKRWSILNVEVVNYVSERYGDGIRDYEGSDRVTADRVKVVEACLVGLVVAIR